MPVAPSLICTQRLAALGLLLHVVLEHQGYKRLQSLSPRVSLVDTDLSARVELIQNRVKVMALCSLAVLVIHAYAELVVKVELAMLFVWVVSISFGCAWPHSSPAVDLH